MSPFSPCQQLPLTITVTVFQAPKCGACVLKPGAHLPRSPWPYPGSHQAWGQPPGAGELQAPQYLMGAWSGLAAPTCSEPTSQQHQATPNIWVHLTSAGMSNGAAAPRMRLQMVWGEGPAPETFPLCGQQVLSTNIPGAPAGQRASATERPSQFRHLNLHLHFLPPK